MADGYPKLGANPPETNVRTSHSVSIKVNGKTIGLINGWNPSMSRQISPIYELDAESSGLVLENVPGNVQGLTVSIQRYDIWPTRMEEAFGTTNLDMLAGQRSPFTVQESWKSPDGKMEVWEYTGCWFSQIGRNIRSDDTRIVNVSATLSYVSRRRVV